ncbi:hypothetical protein CCHL11_04230 [Colletotrichum chlorophyti]|uniref:Uncharacterized protein n=1 Tax=Colletotrichum chlorophyti TaxID=708187 RepID=A0A1Q8RLZ7_9PEZI|nr:hypothetical protein CCHL11_04230 [Colletotrichum chlorophyti]
MGPLVKALEGQDAVVSKLPVLALEEQMRVSEAAVIAGVKRTLPSEYGSDPSAQLGWLTTKEDQIDCVLGLELGTTGFGIASQTVSQLDEANTRFTPNTVVQIGCALISVSKHPVETKNQLAYVGSSTKTQVEVLAAVQKPSGKECKVKHDSSQNIRLKMFSKLGKGEVLEGGAAVIMAFMPSQAGLEYHAHVKGGVCNW